MGSAGAEVTDRGMAADCVGDPPPDSAWPLRTTDREVERMPELARLRSLEERHAALEARIADEDKRPRPDSDALGRMKREKLRLKEEMERLRQAQPVH